MNPTLVALCSLLFVPWLQYAKGMLSPPFFTFDSHYKASLYSTSHYMIKKGGEEEKKKYAEVIWCILSVICYSQASNLAKPGFLHICIYIQTYVFFIKIFNQSNLQIFSYINEGARKEAKHEDYKFLSFIIFLFLTKEVNKQTISDNTIYIFFRCYMLYFMCDYVLPLLLLQSHIWLSVYWLNWIIPCAVVLSHIIIVLR